MLYVHGKTTDVDIVVSVQFSVDIQFDHGTVSSCFSMFLQEYETKMLTKRPGQLSAALKEALGMDDGAPFGTQWGFGSFAGGRSFRPSNGTWPRKRHISQEHE